MIKNILIEFAIKKPKTVMVLAVVITLGFLGAFPSLQRDTDPVKMLPQNNPAVVMHKNVKSTFNIHDYIVLAIESKDGSSLFTAKDLTKIHNITQEILEVKDKVKNESKFVQGFKKLQFLKDTDANATNREIIVTEDVMSLSTVDDILKNEAGELLVTPLMKTPPKTDAKAQQILQQINNNPILSGKLTSPDGSLVGIFVPLQEGKKNRSYYLGQQMKEIADKYLGPGEQYYLGGQPIAESTFGNEMFMQMSVYAPMAGLIIFLLMLFFFRSFKMVIAPMIIGGMGVVWSMGGLIYTGNIIHIMSSMIPIFILPIAVLDSIHILSELHNKMKDFSSREEAIRHVMNDLFTPMFYTSITTMVGFASLATTGIPPVMVFGVTVAFGVFVCWFLSMIFIPAYTMLLSEKSLRSFGGEVTKSPVVEIVQFFKKFAFNNPKKIIATAVVVLIISGIGVSQIVVNDNPVRWFKEDHFLRTADTAINKKLAGTYLTNLYFTVPDLEEKKEITDGQDGFSEFDEFAAMGAETKTLPSVKEAQIIAYIDKLANYVRSVKDLQGNPLVGDVTSIVDVLKKVGKTAIGDDSLPETREKVSQYMFLFESGDLKRGKDMWKLITPQKSLEAQMWLYLKSGDNQNMVHLTKQVKEFMKKNPPPVIVTEDGKKAPLSIDWSGLVYINNVWQDAMVTGMGWALASSFAIVFIMMVFLFRSFLWGVIAMLPLSLTIMFIYGVIGYSGKFYDMPIAVLSSLTLGLSVDFAIHFIEHARMVNERFRNFKKTYEELFKGTAQAIWRNVLVISIGFIPLFFAGLRPYITVGSFFFAIMFVSGITTLILMPAILKQFHKYLPSFKEKKI